MVILIFFFDTKDSDRFIYLFIAVAAGTANIVLSFFVDLEISVVVIECVTFLCYCAFAVLGIIVRSPISRFPI